MLKFLSWKKWEVGDYSTSDLVRELHDYFIQPMSTADKITAGIIAALVSAFTIYLAYRSIKYIWKGDDTNQNKKLL